VSRPVGGPTRQDTKVREARQYFSENKGRAIALLHEAIRTFEEEIAKAGPKVEAEKTKPTPDVAGPLNGRTS
jgi:hypothetical protein